MSNKKDSLFFEVKLFEELTNYELYALLQLRSEVFMFEQHIILPDLDNKDQIALHILGKHEEEIVAYTRIFKPKSYYNEASFGRVVIKKIFRKKGYGHDLIKFVITTIKEMYNTNSIKISAQSYLQEFYKVHGFTTISDEHLEDKIPHVYMLKS